MTITSNNSNNYLSNSKLIILDSDGVVIEENNIINQSDIFISEVRKLGKTVIIFTNNSTKHPIELNKFYKEKNIEIDELLTSSILTKNYCESESIHSAYIIGEKGLVDIVTEAGIQIKSTSPDAVIVGMDRFLTYEKLTIATRAIRNGSRFIATNPDNTFPTPRGLEPGAGTMIAALKASTDKEPEVILGKPSVFGYNMILNKYKLSPSEVLMIGDRYETDIIGAIQLNIPSLIINTGIAKYRKQPGKYRDYPEVDVIPDLMSLLN
ncbi:MAG: HAD-IIA family hydrolase [Candidatus Heimdallarchaeota archaeon]|nr:HAD-IIA family hydrolase [Candidatus Heimdallarchaeota archaeon]MDH5645061.1 HAD-IIA family hydrolase [Candidatus Heimdallarchaeota archaeon]